jgi:hypothetical protein
LSRFSPATKNLRLERRSASHHRAEVAQVAHGALEIIFPRHLLGDRFQHLDSSLDRELVAQSAGTSVPDPEASDLVVANGRQAEPLTPQIPAGETSTRSITVLRQPLTRFEPLHMDRMPEIDASEDLLDFLGR